MNTFPGKTRELGYKNAMKRQGLEVPESYVVNGAFYSRESGYNAMLELLKLPDRPTAVFASGDMLALGAIMAAKIVDFPSRWTFQLWDTMILI